MRCAIERFAMMVVLAVGVAGSTLYAAEEESTKLPTLLIKGEVVSVDTNDPTAALLKVKDRYGFETPIFVTPETQILQGENTLGVNDLRIGSDIAVEYNFDVNTAKRYAVSVALPAAPEPKDSAPGTTEAEPLSELPEAEEATAVVAEAIAEEVLQTDTQDVEGELTEETPAP